MKYEQNLNHNESFIFLDSQASGVSIECQLCVHQLTVKYKSIKHKASRIKYQGTTFVYYLTTVPTRTVYASTILGFEFFGASTIQTFGFFT